MEWCVYCDRYVNPQRKFSWPAFFLLLGFFYLPIYLLQSPQCPICAGKKFKVVKKYTKGNAVGLVVTGILGMIVFPPLGVFLLGFAVYEWIKSTPKKEHITAKEHTATPQPEPQTRYKASPQVMEDAQKGLKQLGFPAKEAKPLVERLAQEHDTLEGILQAALKQR